MQSIKNLENTTSSNVKEKTFVSAVGQQLPKTRGEVAAQEQIRVLRRIPIVNGEARASRTRGEVAAQEQMRVVQQVMTYMTTQPRDPKTRGEVAAQEQVRIFNQVLRM